MKNQLHTLSVLMLIVLSLSACKKDRGMPKAYSPLEGVWVEPQLFGYTRTIFFQEKNQFAMNISDSVKVNTTRYSGTYQVQSDSLKINITQEITNFGSVLQVSNPVNFTLFEKAVFNISNSTMLKLNYITAPADGPVETQAEFYKIIAID